MLKPPHPRGEGIVGHHRSRSGANPYFAAGEVALARSFFSSPPPPTAPPHSSRPPRDRRGAHRRLRATSTFQAPSQRISSHWTCPTPPTPPTKRGTSLRRIRSTASWVSTTTLRSSPRRLRLGCILRGNPARAALAARDKRLQRVTLAQAGVQVPGFSVHMLAEPATDVAAAVRYPCVIKPLRLSASRGVIRADDPRAFVAAQARLAAILAQPDIAGCGEWGEQYLVEDFIGGPEWRSKAWSSPAATRALRSSTSPTRFDAPSSKKRSTSRASRCRTQHRWRSPSARKRR